MRAINHAITGALLGLVIARPVVAIAAALVSHYVLDAVPHYDDNKIPIGSRQFKLYLLLDVALCGLVVILLAYFQPMSWAIATLCAFLATSPDLMWMTSFIDAQHGRKYSTPTYLLARIHAKIQWFERPIGAFVEIVWLMLWGFVLLEKIV